MDLQSNLVFAFEFPTEKIAQVVPGAFNEGLLSHR